MSDIFREIDESMREDKAKELWNRYGIYAITFVILLVGGVAGYVYWQNYTDDRDRARTANLMSAVTQSQTEDPAEGREAISGYIESSGGAPAMMARFHDAALLVEAGEREEALAAYQFLADEADAPWNDLARLLAAMNDLDHGDADALEAELTDLAGGDSAWRHTARELLAMLHVREGRPAEAAAELETLAEESDAPSSLRSRASDLATLYAE